MRGSTDQEHHLVPSARRRHDVGPASGAASGLKSGLSLPRLLSSARWRPALGVVALLLLAGCSTSDGLDSAAGDGSGKSTIDPKYGVSPSPRVVADGEKVPRGGGSYKVGKPYTVAGRIYVPREDVDYRAEGIASWYGRDFHGRRTANGEVFDMTSVTAAHTTLPLPCYVRVTNLANQRSIIARVNNRGPYAGNRLIDLSYRTAELLGYADKGIARVRVEYMGRAPLNPVEDRALAGTLRTDGVLAELPSRGAVQMAAAAAAAEEAAEAQAPLPPQKPEETAVAAATPDADEVTAVAQGAAGPAQTVAHAIPAPSRAAGQPVDMAATGWNQGAQAVRGLSYSGASVDGNGQ